MRKKNIAAHDADSEKQGASTARQSKARQGK